jgi:hypothetical protein
MKLIIWVLIIACLATSLLILGQGYVSLLASFGEDYLVAIMFFNILKG